MKIKLLILLFFVSMFTFGQRKYTADKYFDNLAYKKSAELYQRIYEKGNESYEILSKLGDSHYYNSDFINSEKWYRILMTKFEKKVSSEYFFKYAQSLKSNGKINESDQWLLKLDKLKSNDSRVQKLEENTNYFNDLIAKKKVFLNINNLSINTKYSDFGGFIYNKQLYYASTKPIKADAPLYKWNNQPHLNIYKATESYNNQNETFDLKDSTRVKSLSSRYHESSAVITADGNTVYFTRTNFDGKKLKKGKDETAHLKIYKAEKVNDRWENITELPFNNKNYSTGHPALSTDEKTLYFVSNMPNGFGATDLYKVNILENNTYSTPENLGDKVNTEGREMFPFIDKNQNLYFASDGHLGLGVLDVFETKKENGSYTEPINLGTPINSPYDDFAFVINTEKFNGYFSSNRTDGKGDDDIYSFMIYNCKEDINGIVTDANTQKPIANASVQLLNNDGQVISEKQTEANGFYTFPQLKCNKNFTVVAAKADYKSANTTANTAGVNKQVITANLELIPLIVEDQIVINPIYFDFDKSNIRKDAEYELEHIVSVMNSHPEMIIRIESHTDSRGNYAYNRKLSDRRAKSTRSYIVSRGIASDRIKTSVGFGEEQLTNDCGNSNQKKCSKEEHQKNRRSFFYIVKK